MNLRNGFVDFFDNSRHVFTGFSGSGRRNTNHAQSDRHGIGVNYLDRTLTFHHVPCLLGGIGSPTEFIGEMNRYNPVRSFAELFISLCEILRRRLDGIWINISFNQTTVEFFIWNGHPVFESFLAKSDIQRDNSDSNSSLICGGISAALSVTILIFVMVPLASTLFSLESPAFILHSKPFRLKVLNLLLFIRRRKHSKICIWFWLYSFRY